MLVGVNRDRGAYIIHSLFSTLVGTNDPYRRLFRFHREITPEGIPAIMNSFGALRTISAVSRDFNQVHLGGVPPYGW